MRIITSSPSETRYDFAVSRRGVMKRFVVLGIEFTAGALSISAAALQAPAGGGQPAPRVVEVDKLRDNLYMMRGGGGNSAVFITADGVVVVDTKNPGWGQPLLEK